MIRSIVGNPKWSGSMTGLFDDHGVTFQYPTNWELDVTEDGAVTTVAVHAPKGPAFAIITIDAAKPDPAEIADQALEAMREEYPALDSTPALETIGGHHAGGHDVEFFTLDMTNSCQIRCFRTPKRTVLVFVQWSDIEGDEAEMVLSAIRSSIAETDD